MKRIFMLGFFIMFILAACNVSTVSQPSGETQDQFNVTVYKSPL